MTSPYKVFSVTLLALLGCASLIGLGGRIFYSLGLLLGHSILLAGPIIFFSAEGALAAYRFGGPAVHNREQRLVQQFDGLSGRFERWAVRVFVYVILVLFGIVATSSRTEVLAFNRCDATHTPEQFSTVCSAEISAFFAYSRCLFIGSVLVTFLLIGLGFMIARHTRLIARCVDHFGYTSALSDVE